jgi:NADH:ubiquinone oxidoreductase subunit 6 (subunit J)
MNYAGALLLFLLWIVMLLVAGWFKFVRKKPMTEKTETKIALVFFACLFLVTLLVTLIWS